MFSPFGKMLKNEPGAMGIECGLIGDPILVMAITASTRFNVKLGTIVDNAGKILN